MAPTAPTKPSAPSTLAIILGAADYTRMTNLSKAAFRRSAEAFRDYLLGDSGFALPDANLLYLFDSPDGPSEQELQITDFLKERIGKMKEVSLPATDLLVYYVGHGTFIENNRYVLALKNIREGREDISGFPIRTLANALRENTPNLRRYVILDCCFSASAYDVFQSGPTEVAVQGIREYLPPKGTALLCASGPREPAKAPPDLPYTMFSGALLDILEKGSTDLPERFSLRELGRMTETALKENFTDDAVRPQVLSPDQTEGDISTTPIFPNPRLSPMTLEKRVSHLEKQVRDLETARVALANEVNALKERLDNVHGISEGSPLDEPFFLFKFPLRVSTGLTRSQWEKLTGAVKGDIITYKKRARNGFLWAAICTIVSVLTLGLALRYTLTANLSSVLPFVTTSICGLLTVINLGTSLVTSWKRKGAPLPPTVADSSPSNDYDVVVATREHDWRSVFGLEIEKNAFSLAQLVTLGTFAVSAALNITLYILRR